MPDSQMEFGLFSSLRSQAKYSKFKVRFSSPKSSGKFPCIPPLSTLTINHAEPDSNGLRRASLRFAPTGAIRTMHS